MTTVWDSGADARAFADSARTWIEDGSTPGFVIQDESGSVTVGFAADEATLGDLEGALDG